MKEVKSKNIIEIPKDITAIFLLDSLEDAEKLKKVLAHRSAHHQFLIANNIKILYRKNAWSIIET